MKMHVNGSADRGLDPAALERLSALVDGELEAHAVTQTCANWQHCDGSRGSWHAYQLIGDVLRSNDLASDPARDAAFLQALRRRLVAEPVPETALRAAPAAPGRHGTRLAVPAVAAGFVVVLAGALLFTRVAGQSPGRGPGALRGESMTRVAPAQAVGAVSLAAVEGGPQAVRVDGALVRDVRLDRYLAAHKQFAGTTALGVPSAYLRSATDSGADR